MASLKEHYQALKTGIENLTSTLLVVNDPPFEPSARVILSMPAAPYAPANIKIAADAQFKGVLIAIDTLETSLLPELPDFKKVKAEEIKAADIQAILTLYDETLKDRLHKNGTKGAVQNLMVEGVGAFGPFSVITPVYATEDNKKGIDPFINWGKEIYSKLSNAINYLTQQFDAEINELQSGIKILNKELNLRLDAEARKLDEVATRQYIEVRRRGDQRIGI